jgi:hypothetical protein
MWGGVGAVANPLKLTAMHWAFAAIRGVRIQIPWDSNQPQYGKLHFAFAKGTLQEILDVVTDTCPKHDRESIQSWMKGGNPAELHVGIDCNGFVYRVLDEACRITGAPTLRDTLSTSCEYTALDTLTPKDQILLRARDVQAGDTLRFNKGWHSGVVIETVIDGSGRLQEIWYAHASFTRGPHIGVIQVGDPDGPLNSAAQNWVDSMWDRLTNNGMRDIYFTSVHHTPFYQGPRPRVALQGDLRITVAGHAVSFELPPFVLGGRTLCQVRPLAEAMGATVDWVPASETVTFRKAGLEASCQRGSELGYVNGEEQLLDEPPMLYQERLVVPLRFIAQALGYTVTWDGPTRTADLHR